LQHAFGPASGSCVLGTVPPQHMFGLESTIVFPLQWGCTIHHGRPLLPGDIEYAISTACAPVWLMTTPVHLRACVADGMTLSGVAGAISATMPLDQSSAQAAEQLLQCPLHEIYGCTEAGIMATRRPAHDLEWLLCADFQLRADNGQHWLEGARVVQALELADNVAMRTPEHFSLHGRTGDMIKIAGKRTTLAALNTELLAIDGVIDGSFYRFDLQGLECTQDGSSHDNQRLTAFVVAPQLSTGELIAELRKRIDSVFIPRPLWKVTQLPRDGNGKLSRAALKKLAVTLSAPAASASANRLCGIIPAEHQALDGHFIGNPIVPGVLLLSEATRFAARNYRITGLKQVKFHAPLRPDQAYVISLNQVSPTSIKFLVEHEHSTIASGLLQCEVHHAQE
jgi:acyl-coenzyme A synthetase/AMP-(fatty) acid ligase